MSRRGGFRDAALSSCVRFGLLACAVAASMLIAARPEAISTMPSALSDQDFWSLMAGPLTAVARYVQDHGATVSLFFSKAMNNCSK
jgi:hypothetical protein